ncbi:MAG: ribonuclease III [Candidatus Omnitrophica bacterium]|nr:ribonuclease III [Candidatus Omnitrophota bacterium]
MEDKRHQKLKLLQEQIGYSFKTVSLLELALTHSSFKNELKAHFSKSKALEDNERLEFLGDTILSFIISKKMFTLFKNCAEGTLSKYRSLLVSRKHLFKIAKEMKLVYFLKLGKGEASGTLNEKSNLLANTLEALIAAIYLDGGMKHVEAFILKHFGTYINKKKLSRLDNNYKSALQEYSQKRYKRLPFYHTLEKKQMFYAIVKILKSKKGAGWGKSKREAEQEAAKNLMKKLKKEKSFHIHAKKSNHS